MAKRKTGRQRQAFLKALARTGNAREPAAAAARDVAAAAAIRRHRQGEGAGE